MYPSCSVEIEQLEKERRELVAIRTNSAAPMQYAFAFVTFHETESAMAALLKLDFTRIDEQKIRVRYHLHRGQRGPVEPRPLQSADRRRDSNSNSNHGHDNAGNDDRRRPGHTPDRHSRDDRYERNDRTERTERDDRGGARYDRNERGGARYERDDRSFDRSYERNDRGGARYDDDRYRDERYREERFFDPRRRSPSPGRDVHGRLSYPDLAGQQHHPQHQQQQHPHQPHHQPDGGHARGHRLDGCVPSDTRSLYVGNLPRDVTRAEIESLFAPFAPLLPVDLKTAASGLQAYAFVRFDSVPAAARARHALHDVFCRDCPMNVHPAKVRLRSIVFSCFFNILFVYCVSLRCVYLCVCRVTRPTACG
jgi:RNA recognition motif-containing protein